MAGPRRVRRFWLALHRWLGFAILLFVVVAGVTGSAIAFWRGLDAWLNPDWYRVAPEGERLSLTELSANVVAGHPERKIHGLILPDRPDASLVVLLAADPQDMDELFMDPYTGSVLGVRDTDVLSVDREHLLPFLYRLHYSLHLGRVGEYLLGIAALLWLAVSVAGYWLAWPRGKKPGKWRKALSVKTSAGTPRFLFDLHRAGGLLFGVVLIVVAWTGLWWNMDYAVQPAVDRFLTTTPRYPDIHVATSVAGDIGPDRAMALAESARPKGSVYYIRPLADKQLYSVAMKQPGEADLYGRTTVYVTMDGQIAHISGPAANKPGDSYAQWQLPLHTGQFLGLPGRVLWLVAGLTPLLLAITGTTLWLRKRHFRLEKRGRN